MLIAGSADQVYLHTTGCGRWVLPTKLLAGSFRRDVLQRDTEDDHDSSEADGTDDNDDRIGIVRGGWFSRGAEDDISSRGSSGSTGSIVIGRGGWFNEGGRIWLWLWLRFGDIAASRRM